MERWLLGFATLSAVLGIVALLLIWKRWPWVAKRYQEHRAKWVVNFLRLLTVGIAWLAKPAQFNLDVSIFEQPWTLATFMAAFAFFLWECVSQWADATHKATKEKTAADYKKEIDTLTQDREDAEFAFQRQMWLITALREMVHDKLQRIRRTITDNRKRLPSLPQAKAGLDPDEHIHVILESLATRFRLQTTTSPTGYNQNFRVGLFCEENGYLTLLVAFDLKTRHREPFSSYQQAKDRYRLNNDVNPSHAVRCVVESKMLIVPDCQTADGFEYFNEQQRSYLRSMIACPLDNFCPDGITPTQAALVIDTNIPHFFVEDDRDMLEVQVNEFAVRLNLEYAIRGLISRVTIEGA